MFLSPRLAPALALCLLTFGAGAAVPTPPDDKALKLDERVQAFKYEALLLNRDLSDLDDTVNFPTETRVNVFTSVTVPGFLVSRVSVVLDDNDPVVYAYNETEAKALLKDGFHRLAHVNLAPGPHRLRADFVGKFFDAKPDEAPTTGQLETVFNKGLNELNLVLPIARNSRLDKPGLNEVTRLDATGKRAGRGVWLGEAESVVSDADSFVPGSEGDPHYRLALFLRHDKRFFSALTVLLRIASAQRDDVVLPDVFYQLLAECYLGFAMEERAESYFRQLVETAADPDRFNGARLEMSEFNYQRGYLGEATKLLGRMRDRVGAEDFPRWQTLMAATLLAQGRYNEAAEVIGQGDEEKRITPHLRYNLGVALINDGRVAEGRAWLDKVAQLTPYDQEQLVLKDKANLLLGYHFLQNQQGGTAKPFFARVRTTGPYSNRALLGLGWSELAPRGSVQTKINPKTGDTTPDARLNSPSLGVLMRPGFVDTDVTRRLGIRPYKIEKAAKNVQEAVERALVPWTELITRDPMDPAVQEGLLAVPYAFDTLSAFEQSLQLYTKAVGVLETARKRIDIAIDSIRKGRMVETIVRRDLDSEAGREWRLKDLPDAPETYYLQSLLAEHRFQEPLKNYRDLRLLARNFDNWRPRVEAIARNYGAKAQGTLEPRLMIARALENWGGYGRVSVALREDPQMAVPGAYETKLTDAREPALLWPAEVPQKFEGSREKVLALVARLDALRPVVANLASDQNLYLQSKAIAELEGQRKQIDRYLVQARFAVARINDRTVKGLQ